MQNRVAVTVPSGEVLITTHQTLLPILTKALDFYLTDAKKKLGVKLKQKTGKSFAWDGSDDDRRLASAAYLSSEYETLCNLLDLKTRTGAWV